MKRIFFTILLTILLASCTRVESPDVFLDKLSFELTVEEPETDSETKSAKTGWTKGDKINLWFASDYAQAKPDLVLLYDGSSWKKSYSREGCLLPQNGTFGAIYESGNNLDSKSAEVTDGKSTYKVSDCCPLLLTTSCLDYTIDSKTKVLKGKVSGWTYATRFKVTVKTSEPMDKSADNYVLAVSKECHPVNAFGPAKASDADRITFNVEYNKSSRYAVGIQESDGIAFYFDSFSCNNEVITFFLLENGGTTRIYTTPSAKTISADSPAKCVGVALTYSSFTDATDLSDMPERYGATTDIDLEGSYGPYDIAYHQNDKDDSISLALARNLAARIKAVKGYDSRLIEANRQVSQRKEIIIGRTARPQSTAYYNTSPRPNDFAWKINQTEGNIVITAGGSWALEYAVNKFTEDYLKPGFVYTEGKEQTGTVAGAQLFPITEGCDLRIFDMNVWEYDKTSNPAGWTSAGEKCTLAARIPRYRQLIRAYMPDILLFQEYTNSFNNDLYDALRTYGYTFSNRQTKDFTPVIYNENTVKYFGKFHLDFGDFTASDGSVCKTGGRKSLTANVFEHIATKKKFIVVSTHWWANHDAAGDECRLDEAVQLRDYIDNTVLKTYNYPVFVAGDLNCKSSSEEMQILFNAGYQNVITSATLSADGSMGWHFCNENGFMREYDYKPSTPWWMGNVHDKKDQGRNCVDQFLIYNNNSGIEVKVFERVHTWFTILISDHYPNYADIKL